MKAGDRPAARGVVHLLCGLPGCGKTTYARRLASDGKAVVLGHDERMLARHGSNPPAADFARLAAEISEEVWREAAAHLAAGRDVILDWGFWTRAQRVEARARAVALGAACRLHWVQCPDDVARARTLRRSEERAGQVLAINAEAWDLFQRRFEPPEPSEGADRVDGLGECVRP
jgi:predicted kinase